MAKSVFDQAREMSEHVAKVLQMTRLEPGAITVDRDWTSLSELVGAVLARLGERMARTASSLSCRTSYRAPVR